MAEIDSIGLIELSSVARGFVVQDAMIKAANIQVLMARTICSGKYIVCVAGDISAVQASVDAGVAVGDWRGHREAHHLARPPSHISGDAGQRLSRPYQADALGIIETFSASSIIEVADAAVKAANVDAVPRTSRHGSRR